MHRHHYILRPRFPYATIRRQMNLHAAGHESGSRVDLFNGLFRWHPGHDGPARVSRYESSPATIPCPSSGRLLRVATLEAASAAICPACASHGAGGFVSFVGDLRMAYACPGCCQLIWLAGA
jgi:hypothetical protein